MRILLRLLLLAVCLVTQLPAQEPDAPRFDELEYEMGQRATRELQEQLKAHGIDATTIRDEWLRETDRKRGAGTFGATEWEFLGPRNQSGRIMGLGVARHDTNVWYCAADGGGIWKSVSHGSRWTPLTDTLPSLRMAALALSPFDDNLVIGATHEGLIYRSSDAGASWEVIPGPGIGFVYDIQFDPGDSSMILMAASGGLIRSDDAGRTWTQIRPGGRALSISFDTKNSSTIYYSQNSESGAGRIYKTSDGGETWSLVKIWGLSYWGRLNVRVAPSNPSIIYASVSDSATYYRSEDGGLSWTPLASQPVRDSYTRAFDLFEVSPEVPEIIIAGGTALFRTTDGGEHWKAGDTINKDVHVDQHAFLFPPHLSGAFICGNDGGIFKTDNYIADSLEWVRRDTSLATLQIYNCTMHPVVPDTIIVGCQDNGYDKFSGDDEKWKVIGGDGFCTIYDYENPLYFYHEYVYHNLHRADNGFTWWSKKVMNGLPTDTSSGGFYTGFSSPDRSDWYGQGITMSPSDSKTLYIGSNRLYKSVDRADHWNLLSDQDYSLNKSDFITSIAVAPKTSHRLYLGTNAGKVFRVIDEGDDPESVDITPSFGPLGRMRGFAVAPDDPDIVYACGDGGWSNRGVVATTDGGESWVVKSEGLPTGGVNRIIFDPDSSNTLYAGTIFGLFYTRDGGERWHRMPEFPNVEVWDFAFHLPTRTFLVGTYGRGAIRARNFDPPPPPPAPSDVHDLPATVATSLSIDVLGNRAISVRLDRGGDVTVEIYDYLGRNVRNLFTGYLSSGEHLLSLPITESDGLRSGAYLVVLRSGGRLARRSLTVVR